METHEYSNGEITILWKPRVCVHSGICVKALPKVYNPKAKPWLKPENATTEELRKQIAQCPSGALSIKNNRRMEETKIILDEHKAGEIALYTDGHKAGKMEIAISGNLLPVYHTEVSEQYNGRGFAKLLLGKLVSYARENSLKVVPLCPYVLAQFKRHPDEYEDVWYKEEA